MRIGPLWIVLNTGWLRSPASKVIIIIITTTTTIIIIIIHNSKAPSEALKQLTSEALVAVALVEKGLVKQKGFEPRNEKCQ